MRIEGRHTRELWNERYKVMRQISELDKKLRTESGDKVPIYREIKRLEEVEKSLAEQIRTVEKQVEEEKQEQELYNQQVLQQLTLLNKRHNKCEQKSKY